MFEIIGFRACKLRRECGVWLPAIDRQCGVPIRSLKDVRFKIGITARGWLCGKFIEWIVYL